MRIRPKLEAERVDPEQLGVLGVAPGQVAGHALVEPELVEEAEGGGHPLLHVGALLVGRVERREVVGTAVGHRALRWSAVLQLCAGRPPVPAPAAARPTVAPRPQLAGLGVVHDRGRAVEDCRGPPVERRRPARAGRRWRGTGVRHRRPCFADVRTPSRRVPSSSPPSSRSTPPRSRLSNTNGTSMAWQAPSAPPWPSSQVEPVHGHLGRVRSWASASRMAGMRNTLSVIAAHTRPSKSAPGHGPGGRRR